MDIVQLAGLAGVPYIRLLVKQLNLSGISALVAATLFGIVINVLIAIIAGNEFNVAIATGAVAGLLANFYNDVKTDMPK